MTRIERSAAPIHPSAPHSRPYGRLLSAIWRSQRWLRRLIGAAIIILAIAVGLAYYGIANVPVVSPVVYRPVAPLREVSEQAFTMSPEALNGRLDLSEGQLTALLQQLKRLPGSATIFYNLQAAVEPGRIEISGRLFRAGGFYGFIAQAEPRLEQRHLALAADRLRVQKIGLPASYIQPLLDQLALTVNGALLNAPLSQAAAESGRLRLTIEPTMIR